MGEQTGIEWCHHTFNPWRGCTKLSAGCAHCYAETLSHRNPAVLGIWGDQGTRVPAADAYWLQALAWHKAAIEAGEVRRVFCGSLMDVGEDRRDLDPLRDRLMALIALTPLLRHPATGRKVGLHWLLLTKRPAALRAYLDAPGLYDRVLNAALWWRSRRLGLSVYPISDPGTGNRSRAAWYPQLAIGVSVEDQAAADERIPELLQIDVATRFLSMEPLLGPVNVADIIQGDGSVLKPLVGLRWAMTPQGFELSPKSAGHRIGWIIVGGESGSKARPMHPAWARSLRDQAAGAGVPFLFKQWGEHWPGVVGRCYGRPSQTWTDGQQMFRIGKREAGRDLDGRTWDEVPGV